MTERLFAGLTPGNTNVAENTPVSLGTTFIPAVDGTVDGQLFRASDAPTGTYTAKLYQMATSDTDVGAGGTGTLVTGSTQAYGTITATADNQVLYTTPVAVTAGVVYKSVLETSTGHYTATNDFFTTADSVSGNLNAPKDTAVKGSFTVFNGTFVGGTAYPVGHFRSTLYHITPLFTATPTGWTKDVVETYRVLNGWSKDVIERYRVLNGWTKDVVERFRVYNVWSKDVIERYRVTNAWTKDVTEQYRVLNGWSKDTIERYRVYQGWTKDVVETYNILSGTAWAKDVVERYRILNGWSKDVVEKYRVTNAWAIDTVERYRVLNGWTKDVVDRYRIFNSWSKDVSESYRVLNGWTKDTVERYSILSGTAWSKDVSERYRIYNSWLRDVVERYNIGAVPARRADATVYLGPVRATATLGPVTAVARLHP